MSRKLSILAFLLVSAASVAHATVPQSFSVQGVLRDKQGMLQSTMATVVVNFFANQMPMQGEKSLNATPVLLMNVGVSNGLFTINVPLSADLAATFANPNVWLQMTVNSDTFPRQLVTPDVYALMCGTADVANSLADSLANPTWTPITFAGAWANYGGPYNPAGYYKDALGWVHLRGLIANGAGVITTLPAGYRPTYQHLEMGQGYAGGYIAMRIDVAPDGTVTLNNPATPVNWVSLDQIVFKVP